MAAADLIRSVVKKMRIEVEGMPPLDLDDPFAPGPPNPYAQMLKPRITFQTTLGPVVSAPYGVPQTVTVEELEDTAGAVFATLLFGFAGAVLLRRTLSNVVKRTLAQRRRR